MVKSQNFIFFENHINLTGRPGKAAYLTHSLAIQAISMAGYVVAILASVGVELRAGRRAVSVILRITFCDFTLYCFL